MKIKKQPEVRFDNYTDEWKMLALKNVVNRVTRKNKELKTQLPLTISAQYGLVDQVTYFNKQIASKDMSNYYLLERGEFAYNKSYSRDYPWGAIKRLDNYDMGALSSLYITFKPFKINSDFLLSYYNTNKWHKEVSTRATEGARNHGLLNISANDFLETELAIPLEEEQEKIGLFFKHLDDDISLQQQELDTLKQTKRGFMQKMFPKEGESVPKVRFSGFTDDWKRYSLKDLAEVGTGKAFESTDFIDDGEYMVITNKNILDQTNGIVSRGTRINISDQNVLKKYVLSGENVLVTMDGANIGVTGKYSNDKAVLAQRVGRLNSKQIEFIYQVTKSSRFIAEMNKLSVGNAIKHISLNQISNYSFMAPVSEEEQEKIGEFFKKFDRTIALQQQELEALKQTKKAFLQKMFV